MAILYDRANGRDARAGGARGSGKFPLDLQLRHQQPLLVLGVINVYSFEQTTGLLALFDLPDVEQKARMKDMHTLINLACGQSFIM